MTSLASLHRCNIRRPQQGQGACCERVRDSLRACALRGGRSSGARRAAASDRPASRQAVRVSTIDVAPLIGREVAREK
eukprot:6260198-Alexandrium_andersonii.AAC.1